MRRVDRLDLTNKTFGRWTVLEKGRVNKRGEIYWKCRCHCGKEREVKAGSLTSGKSASCGCYHRFTVTSHGMTGTPTFKSWESMKQRCLNPNATSYHLYGGRGIKIYKPWIHNFEDFIMDMGVRPEGTTLDRIDPDGDYTPDNCRWATPRQQMRNRRDNVQITYKGRIGNAYVWAEETGIPAKVIRDRLYAGWEINRTLETPFGVNPTQPLQELI